jgi:hypothetical protein
VWRRTHGVVVVGRPAVTLEVGLGVGTKEDHGEHPRHESDERAERREEGHENGTDTVVGGADETEDRAAQQGLTPAHIAQRRQYERKTGDTRRDGHEDERLSQTVHVRGVVDPKRRGEVVSDVSPAGQRVTEDTKVLSEMSTRFDGGSSRREYSRQSGRPARRLGRRSCSMSGRRWTRTRAERSQRGRLGR